MGARSDFWLHVHKLAQCLEEEGATTAERRQAILDSLRDMPPTARGEVAGELESLFEELQELRPHINGQLRALLPPR